jgi:hypothetical protein
VSYRRRTRLPARFVILAVVVEFLIISLVTIGVAEAQDDEHWDFIVKTKTALVGIAVYDRVLDSGGVWLDGDRVGYAKAYGFLDCNTTNPLLNMRVAAFAYTSVVKAQIIDKFMAEGTRRWDGTIEPDGEIPARDSDAPRLTDHGTGWPTSFPVITIADGDDVCEIRDYNNVVTGAGVTFALVEDTPTQVIVGWYVDGQVAAEFYYTILGGTYRLEVE